jgi:uncharacterized tellurite resistance protein B-like protein
MGSVVPLKSLRPTSPSLIALWRCIIAVAHADGIIHEKEQAHFDRVFSSMTRAYDVSAAQLKTFADDLKTPQAIDGLLPGITDLEMRCLLANFAHAVAHVDGELHPEEKEILAKIDATVPSSPEAQKIRDAIQGDIARQMAQHAGDMQDEDGARACTLTYAIDALLERLGIAIPGN